MYHAMVISSYVPYMYVIYVSYMYITTCRSYIYYILYVWYIWWAHHIIIWYVCMLECSILSYRLPFSILFSSQCFFLVVSLLCHQVHGCFLRGFGSAVNSIQGIFSFQILYFFFRTSFRTFLDFSSSCSWFLLHLMCIFKLFYNIHFTVPVCKFSNCHFVVCLVLLLIMVFIFLPLGTVW